MTSVYVVTWEVPRDNLYEVDSVWPTEELAREYLEKLLDGLNYTKNDMDYKVTHDKSDLVDYFDISRFTINDKTTMDERVYLSRKRYWYLL